MVDGNHLSDKAQQDLILVKQAIDGKQSAYAELMEKYRESIYFMMLKMVKNNDDADDLTIEAFGKAFNRLEQYSPSFAFSTWLFKIASNNCIDFIRKKRISVTSMDSGRINDDGEVIYFDAKSSTLDPEECFIQDQKVKLMRELVTKLKPRYRVLIEKRYFEEFGKENILLIDYEDFKNDVGKAVYLVYSFLDISTEFSANINKKHNAFTMPKNKLIRFVYSFVFLRNILVVIFSKQLIKKIRSFLFKNDDKPVMLSSTRDQLKKLFKSDIENLGLLIDKDYTKWIK